MSTAWDRASRATQVQPAPNFVYFKVEFNPLEYRKILFYRVDQGYGWLLRYATAAWYDRATLLAGTFQMGNAPEVEYYVRRQSRQSEPIPFTLLSSPCSVAGGDAAIQPLLVAAPLLSWKFENYFIQFGDTLEFHIVRDPTPYDPLGYAPACVIHLVLKGYDVPEPQARIW